MDPDIISFLDAINFGIGTLVAIIFALFLLGAAIWYIIGRVRSYAKKGEGPGKVFFLGTLILVEVGIFAFALLLWPEIIAKTAHQGLHNRIAAYVVLSKTAETGMHWFVSAYVFRWIFLYFTVPLYFYYATRKYSGKRGLYAGLVILTIALFGWQFEHWIGILLIALPIYAILLSLLYQLAQVVLPSAHPEDKKERKNKFMAMFAYMLGAQFPVWIAKDSAGRDFDNRIKGNNFSGGIEPGIVWTHSHQAAGISAGIEFTQVEGPGIIFTKIYDRPVALVDLRTQIRIVEFDAITKDGIAFKAIMFAAFVIDFEDWPKKNWKPAELEQMAEDIEQNPYLEKGIKVDQKVGSYWYSTARVKSVLSTAGINTNPKDGEAGPAVNWDDWVLKQVENAARQVLSQRTMDGLWRPVDNKAGASALDEIGAEIRKIVGPKLRRTGINLYACRVVNFNLPEDSLIRKQQIDSWKAPWNQRITAARSDAIAIRGEEIEKAHAYAKSKILDAIADSIKKARDVNPDLPRHVIALYYIHAIEEVIQEQPEPGSKREKERKERFDMIKSYLLYNQR